MNSAIRWFVPKRSRTAHAYLSNLGNGNVEFWCGIVRGQYEIRCPRKGEAKCKDCKAFIRHRKGTNVSRAYEMTVEIKDYKARNLPKIIRACCEEWDFEPDDFTNDMRYDPPSQKLRRARKVIATAQGNLCGGEQDNEFAKRLTMAIWKANGGFCQVEVRAVYLEELPYETFTYDEDEFKTMMEGGEHEAE